MQTGELIGSGRTADVFAINDRWVLRRYRNGRDATAEAVVMTHLAAHGYPVPQVRQVTGDGTAPRTDLVMRRLSGPSMLEALMEGAITTEEAGTMLAELLHRLHAVPTRVSTDPADRILHLDLHPGNVILTPDGPVVIDWPNAEEGPAGLDWGMSALILAQVAVDPAIGPAAPGARSLLAALLAGRTARGPAAGPGDAARPEGAAGLGDADAALLAQAKEKRAADPHLSEREVRLLDDALALVLELA